MTARVKLAYLVPASRQFAGIERVVHEIATGLQSEHGDVFDVHVVYASDYPDEQLRAPAYRKHVLGVTRLLNIPRAVRSLARRERFDVLICPQVEASVMGWLGTRGLGIGTFVSHLHGNPELERREGSVRTKLAFAVFERFMTRSIHAILAVSPSLAHYADDHLAHGVPVYYAKNPVRDLDAPERSPRAPGTPFRLVCVARLNRQKGQDILLRALAHARADLPPVRLTLVGNGPLESELRALATSLHLDDVVEFTGYVSDPRPYLVDADAFVLASRWEGFGVALAEALQFGLPLVTTNCRFGPSDIVDDPRIGELVPAEDHEALAAALMRVVAAPQGPDNDAFRRERARSYYPAPATAAHFDILSRLTRGATPDSHLRAARRHT